MLREARRVGEHASPRARGLRSRRYSRIQELPLRIDDGRQDLGGSRECAAWSAETLNLPWWNDVR